MKCVDVAIAGGGLGGLALAAGLIHRGYDAHVFEAAPELRTATSTLITLGGNGFTALERLHPTIVPKLKASGSQWRSSAQYLRPSRDQPMTVKKSPAMNPESQPHTMRWSEVQRVLADLVPSAHVHCCHRSSGYTEHAEDGHVLLHFKDQPDVKARLVVGADGLRSAIRAQMVPNDPGIRYLGSMGWNALLYNPDNSVVYAHEPGEVCSWTDSPVPAAWKYYTYIMDAGGGWTYFHTSLASETPAFTPPPANGSAAGMGSSERPSNVVWGGLGKPGSKARLMALLEEAGFEEPMRVLEHIPESDLFERCSVDRLPLDVLHGSMSSPSKRVVLLGDAAHAMHAGPGQGARSAFEDAHTLMAALHQRRSQLVGWRLSPSSLSDDSSEDPQQLPVSELRLDAPAGSDGDTAAVRAAVEQYEQLRMVRTCRIQRFASEMASLPSVREVSGRPADLSPEQRGARFGEFFKWLNTYPDNPEGDPNSTYWKPPQVASQHAPATSQQAVVTSQAA